jgi:large subunit ribosomal protein L13
MVGTIFKRPDEFIRKWHLVDATGIAVGRLSTQIAMILRGKNKPDYTPHIDCGDGVIVINAEKVHFTGKKWQNKMYHQHSGYIGGLKTISARHMLEKKPEVIIRHAVKGMLPKNRLGRAIFRKLKVYPGKEHPHDAQVPESIKFE